MTTGFLETFLDTRSSNGRDDVLLSDLHFRSTNGLLYKVAQGSETDGMSTPRLFWAIPGFEPCGEHWFCYVLHDAGYRGTLLVWDRTIAAYVPANVSRLEADQLMADALTTKKAPPLVIASVYRTLRLLGWRNYRKA